MKRPGLTLVELLVVLLILVILTTVAVQSTENLVVQGRYEATQRTMQTVQSGVLGPPNLTGADGGPAVAGFVADLGRLPLATLEDRGAKGQILTLSELWVRQAGVAPFSLQAAPAPDADILVPCGWRGPYVQLPVGGTRLLDGWGTELVTPMSPAAQAKDFPYSCLLDGGAVPAPLTAAGQTVGVVRSPGQNKATAPGETDYGRDMEVRFSLADYQAALFGTVEVNVVIAEIKDKDGILITDPTKIKDITDQIKNSPPTGSVAARVFGPAPPSGLVGVFQPPAPSGVVGGQGSFLVLSDAAGTVPLTAGPRVLRAYCTGLTVTAPDLAITPVALPVATIPMPLALRPGANVAPRIRIPVAVKVQTTT